MNEVILAVLSGLTVWCGLTALRRKDPVVVGRVAALAETESGGQSVRSLAAVLRLLGRTFPPKAPESARQLLAAAGMAGVPVESLRGTQLLFGALGFSLGASLGTPAVVFAPVGTMLGYHAVLIYLGRRARSRKDEMAAALPDVVDLLAVCTHAGLNISLSLRRISGRVPGPMGTELQRVVEEMELGIPRSKALMNLVARTGLPDLEALVRVLLNSERFGTEISDSLQAFSAEVRTRRKRWAEEQARKAPVKILFPLVFLILPAFILLTVVPLLMSAFESMNL